MFILRALLITVLGNSVRALYTRKHKANLGNSAALTELPTLGL
jgi:hypothetical protein